MRNLTLCRLFALRLCLFISAGSAEAGQEAVAQPNASEGLSKKTNAKKAAPDDLAEADARKLFSELKTPSASAAKSIGEASCGCLAGAERLAEDGPGFQVMRLSRNRYWGHPSMISYIKKLALDAQQAGWNGLLIGDLSMPRGGPMPSGHASHQRGTDVDIWLSPAPDHKLSREERESLSAGSVLKLDSAELDPAVWTTGHAALVRTAAKDDNVARVFVSPAIKKYLCSCKDPDGKDTSWLRRLRPWEGHDDHIHVRLRCPPGEPCVEQDAPPEGDGCGDELAEWMKKTASDPPNKSVKVEEKSEYKSFPLNKLPPECRELLNEKSRAAEDR